MGDWLISGIIVNKNQYIIINICWKVLSIGLTKITVDVNYLIQPFNFYFHFIVTFSSPSPFVVFLIKKCCHPYCGIISSDLFIII